MPRLSEKLTLLPLSLFMIGWGLYVAGFAWLLTTWTTTDTGFTWYMDHDISRTDPTLFPFYLTLAGGPLVAVLGCLHATTKRSSSMIFGALSAIVSVIYFVSAGAVSIYISTALPEKEFRYTNRKIVLMLTGVLIEELCWCSVLILSVFYEYPRREESLQSSYSVRRGNQWPFTPGIARVLSVPCIVLSFLGWCVFSAGLYKRECRIDLDICFGAFYSSGVFVIAPLLYLAALLHAGCSGGASTIMRVFASILNIIYLYLIGSDVTDAAIMLYYCHGGDQGPEWPYLCYDMHISASKILLGGGVVSLVFWGCAFALWPFYRKHPSTDGREGTEAPPHLSPDNQSNLSEPPPTYGAVQHPNYYFETRPLIGST